MVKEELASFRRRELGFIFQDFNLIHTLTVEENIMLPLSLEGVPANEITKRTREVARYLGLKPSYLNGPLKYQVVRHSVLLLHVLLRISPH